MDPARTNDSRFGPFVGKTVWGAMGWPDRAIFGGGASAPIPTEKIGGNIK